MGDYTGRREEKSETCPKFGEKCKFLYREGGCYHDDPEEWKTYKNRGKRPPRAMDKDQRSSGYNASTAPPCSVDAERIARTDVQIAKLAVEMAELNAIRKQMDVRCTLNNQCDNRDCVLFHTYDPCRHGDRCRDPRSCVFRHFK